MPATPDTPDFRLLAPAFAGRFAVIAAGLVALIAREFLRHPDLAPLILPLCRRLGRGARRLAALMARLAMGQPARHRRPGAKGATGGPKSPIPTTRAWLVRALRHEAAAFASQLSHLLAEPGVSDLLAASPAATRLLRPLCRMLGIPLGDRRAPSRTESPATALPAAPRSTNPPKKARSPATTATPSPDTAPQASAYVLGENPETAAPIVHPPYCPHLGWPWFPRAKRA